MIRISNLHKTFNPGTINEVRALRGLDLVVEPGEFVTVIGSNGAGKSTLLNMVAGTFPCDSGQIVLDGQDVTNWPEYSRAKLLGRVFQDPLRGTAGAMSIEQNMAMAELRGLRRGLRLGVTRARRKRYAEALETLGLGLERRMGSDVALLSGGQRQALTLLMASLTHPRVLLLDEHTAALDPIAAAQVAALTDKIVRENNLTTLMITHNMQQALSLGDRTIMMHRGQILFDLSGPERKTLTVTDLVQRFSEVRSDAVLSDATILAD